MINTDDTIKLAKQLMEIPSVSPEDGGCQGLLLHRLKAYDFTTRQLAHDGASNFWAEHGSEGPCLVFAGHTDVVPTGDLKQWKTDPFKPTIKNGYLYGRGAADMKGSLAAMFIAVEQFIEDYPNHPGKIAFLITSAEEGPSEKGTPIVIDYLNQKHIDIDYCIVGEPTTSKQLGDTVKIGRRGSLHGTATIQGIQGHVAYPHLAKNPIHEVGKLIHDLANTQWDQPHPDFPLTTLQIHNIHGGTGARNVIPGEVQLAFNFRFSPAVTPQQLQQKTEAFFKQHQLDYTIDWELTGEPFLTPKGVLTDTCIDVIQSNLGITPELSTTGGTSDGRYIAKTGAQVIEFGPCNKTIHQINEHVAIDDLKQLTELYYHLTVRLLKSSMINFEGIRNVK